MKKAIREKLDAARARVEEEERQGTVAFRAFMTGVELGARLCDRGMNLQAVLDEARKRWEQITKGNQS